LATSIDTFTALRNIKGVQAILSGGVLHSVEDGSAGTLTGSLTVQAIKSLRFDAVCLSTMAFDPALGVYDSNWDDVAIKQALISVAQRVFLLVDHSKWSTPRGVKVCDCSAIHTVITDRHPGAAAVKQLPQSLELICGTAIARA
ncbi:MAG TPA: hypothetical protein VL860_11655, partial [Planctomycetota bacterium]|nr:hypothetical protein [Planctomycetota bacterium]